MQVLNAGTNLNVQWGISNSQGVWNQLPSSSLVGYGEDANEVQYVGMKKCYLL